LLSGVQREFTEVRNTATVVHSERRSTAVPTPRRKGGPTAPSAAIDPSPTIDASEDGTSVPIAAPRPAPRRPGLIPTDIADALSAVLTKSIAAIRTHEDGSRAGGNLESVHQMRVATRRIRAYLKAAKPALEGAAADRLRQDLSALAQVLGTVRDLDVMIDRLHTEAAALGKPDTAALETLIGSLDSARRRARSALIVQLDDPQHAGLLAELDAAAARPPVANPWADLAELGAIEYRRLAKAQHRLESKYQGDPPDDELHVLRILGKRTRYAGELQRKTKTMSRFLDALAAFQEVLGDHQDVSVLEDELRAMVAKAKNPAAAIAAGRVIEGGRRRKIEARAAYPAAWGAVAEAAEAAYAEQLDQ
jgi:CHAD domain-containing protein